MRVSARIRATILVQVDTSRGLILVPQVIVPAAEDWQIADGVEDAQAARARALLQESDESWFYDADLLRGQLPAPSVTGLVAAEHEDGHRARSGWLFSDAPEGQGAARDTRNGPPRDEASFCDFSD